MRNLCRCRTYHSWSSSLPSARVLVAWEHSVLFGSPSVRCEHRTERYPIPLRCALERERRAEEADRHREESLLRAESWQASRTADVYVFASVVHGVVAPDSWHMFLFVRNAGPAVAQGVRVSRLSGAAPTLFPADGLNVGDLGPNHGTRILLGERLAVSEADLGNTLVSWTDGNGSHRLTVEVRLREL